MNFMGVMRCRVGSVEIKPHPCSKPPSQDHGSENLNMMTNKKNIYAKMQKIS